ncbi:MAG: hypothetical protein AB7O86_05615 [Porticoccaceae bacterium]
MSGNYYVPLGGRHECAPGWERSVGGNLILRRSKFGEQFECSCGKWWVADEPPFVSCGQQQVGPVWRRETRRERRRRLGLNWRGVKK